MQVRLLNTLDAPRLFVAYRLAFTDVQVSLAEFTDMLRYDRFIWVGVEDDNQRILGFCAFVLVNNVAYSRDTSIIPTHRHEASAISKLAFDYMRDTFGVKELRVESCASQLSIDSFEGQGFDIVGSAPPRANGDEALLFSRSLV
jgi:hypothetical protein